MTTEDKNKIFDLVTLKMQSISSQEQAATQIGMSGATFSQLLNKKWSNISDDMWRRAGNWIGYSTIDWKIVETKNYKAILSLCADAKRNHRSLAIAGYTGAGKTTGLRKYANTHSGTTFYVECKVSMGRKDLLGAILRALGKDVEGSVSYRLQFVCDFLLTKVDNPLIIFDSTHKCTDQCYEIIQQLTEALERKCGIVISGTERLKHYILKMAAKGKSCFPELKRRIGYWQPMYDVQRKVIELICEPYGINDKRAVDYVVRVAQDYGTLYELMINYSMADKEGMSQLEVLTSLHVGDTNLEAA